MRATALAFFGAAAVAIIITSASTAAPARATGKLKLTVWSTSRQPLTCEPWALFATVTDGHGNPVSSTLHLKVAISGVLGKRETVTKVPSGSYQLHSYSLSGQGDRAHHYTITANASGGRSATVNYAFTPTTVIAQGSGEGTMKWPPLDVPCNAAFEWSSSGESFVTMAQAFSINSNLHAGTSFIAAGRYELQVIADGSWEFRIVVPS